MASSNDPSKDFALQMSKLAHGLLSGEYSKTPDTPAPVADDQPVVIVRLRLKFLLHCVLIVYPVVVLFQKKSGIRPSVFKSLIGKDHPEFSTKRQQDAQEFILHLFDVIEVFTKRGVM